MDSWLFGKKSKANDEKASYYTSVPTQRVHNVIQFKRGYKHLFYSKLALLDYFYNLDVVDSILSILVEMTNSSHAIDFSLVSTLGGIMDTGDTNRRDGELSSALFPNPFGVYIDHNGHLFVLDSHSIRLVELNTEKKLVHTIAGNQTQGTIDGNGEESRFMLPVFMSQDPQGDYLILESHGHQIRKLSFNQGVLGNEITPNSLECKVSTSFKFNRDEKDLSYPHWIGYDPKMKLICTDTVHNDVCILNLEKRKRKSLVKNAAIPFYYPAGCCFNSSGDLFICDYHHHCIKKVPFSKKGDKQRETEIFAGTSQVAGFMDGKGEESQFWNPNGIALDVDEYLLVADAGNNAIRRISPSGVVTTIAGMKSQSITPGSAHVDGKGANARFSTPTNLVIDDNGNIIVADWKNSALRMVQF